MPMATAVAHKMAAGQPTIPAELLKIHFLNAGGWLPAIALGMEWHAGDHPTKDNFP
jgi:hypothetical protein